MTQKNIPMHYPLLFGYHDLVAGEHFVAGVSINGRGLLVQEEEGWWLYGVNPGVLAASGDSREEAILNFRQTWRAILYDLAGDGGDFATFQREVEEVFRQTNRPNEELWQTAAEEISAGRPDAHWLPTRKASEQPLRVAVDEVSGAGPRANQLDDTTVAAAA